MELVVKDDSGCWAQVLTQEQFDVINKRLVESMNGGKRLTDLEVLLMLARADKPVEFLSSVLMDVALYFDAPYIRFLGGWLGADVDDTHEVFNLVRDLMNNKDYANFDMHTDELTQRTFLFLVAYAEGARIPR